MVFGRFGAGLLTPPNIDRRSEIQKEAGVKDFGFLILAVWLGRNGLSSGKSSPEFSIQILPLR